MQEEIKDFRKNFVHKFVGFCFNFCHGEFKSESYANNTKVPQAFVKMHLFLPLFFSTPKRKTVAEIAAVFQVYLTFSYLVV